MRLVKNRVFCNVFHFIYNLIPDYGVYNKSREEQ